MTSPYTHDKLLRQKVEEIISKWQEGADRKADVRLPKTIAFI